MGTFIDPSLITEDHMEKIRAEYKDPNLTLEEVQQYPMEYIETLMGSPMKTDFDFSSGSCYDDGMAAVGIPYEKMKGDETLNQFKQRVKDGIKEKLNLDLEVAHIELCWEDR